jgi:cytoskeletal protein CcmA (bactofilin family)
MKINVNGKQFEVPEGSSVNIRDNKIYIDDEELNGGIEVGDRELNIYIAEGARVEGVRSDKSLNVHGEIHGNVQAGGAVNCDGVEGDVYAGGAVNCDDIHGNVQASVVNADKIYNTDL